MSRPSSYPIPQASPASPTAMASAIQADLDALRSQHKGSGTPAYALAGTIWIDDSATPWVVNVYDGSDVIPIGTIDPTGNVFRAARALDRDGTLAMLAPLTITPGTVSGNNVYAVKATNPGSGVGTEVTLDLAPNSAGSGARSVQIAAVEAGTNQPNIVFRTANAGSPTARFIIGYDGSIYPAGDNTQTLGKSGNRFSTVYAGTGTINTSDATQKKWLGGWSDQEKAALKACLPLIGKFQFLDAIAEKGEDQARIHCGVIAQEVVKAFEDHGLDPWHYAWMCRDKKIVRTEKTRTESRPLMETITVQDEVVELTTDGRAVRKVVSIEVQRTKMREYPLTDEAGEDLGTHLGPEMEDVTVTYVEETESPDEWIYGVRYEELAMALISVMVEPAAA